MSSGRRDFLWQAPAALMGLGVLPLLHSGQQPAGHSEDAVDFWVNQMGVAPHLLPGGEEAAERGRKRDINAAPGIGREPIFYYVDKQSNSLVSARELTQTKLMPSGDANVELALQRLRLSGADQQKFQKISSGAIYLDCSQHQSNTDTLSQMASSMFSAFFPDGSFKNPFAKTKSTKSTKSQFLSSFAAQSKGSSGGSGIAAAVQLQGPGQTQSIALPGGIGKTAFSCFIKDHKTSVFGLFVSAISKLNSTPLISAVPLLSMPVIAGPALQAMRLLAGKLQSIEDKNQHSLLQTGPIDMAATVSGAKALQGCVMLAPGDYIVIPKEQGDALTSLKDLKVMDGFLVPKDTDERGEFRAISNTMPGLSYLSLSVKVSQAKLSNCLLPMPGSSSKSSSSSGSN